MLTDLPEARIAELDETLSMLGFKASVLVEERDDPVTQFCAPLFKNARTIVDGMAQHMNLSAKIYFCLIVDANKDFQACAMKLGADEYCIAVWLAVPLRTSAMTSRLMATISGRSILGITPEIETDPVEALGKNTFEAYQALSFLPAIGLGAQSDELRKHVDLAAFEWLVLHELGHIVNGHLSTGASLNGLTYILEDDPSSDRDGNLTSQALELDADSFATLFGIQNAMRRSLPVEQDGPNLDLRVKVFVFGIMTIIRSFDDAPFEVETMFDSDHPPGGVRMGYLASLIATMELEKKVNFGGVEASKLAGETAITIEIAIEEATGMKSGGGNLLKAFEVGWDAFHVPVLSRWARLHDSLVTAKLTPFKLAPPQYPAA